VSTDLEREVDRLYGLDLDRFVDERTSLARALRSEGRRAEATRAQELRKPTLPAWTVNQLARRKRKDVDLLLDAAHRLATAQADVLQGGDPGQFAEARERERAALRRLEEGAREILGERAAEATLRRVSETLRAAAVSEQARELLARGRLTAELEPTGFEAFAAIAPATPARVPRKPPPPRESKPMRKRPEARAVDEQVKRREEESRAKREQAAARRDAIAEAREAVRAARERERELADRARAAQRALREAQQGLRRAEREVEQIEAERQAAADEVEAATRALDDERRSR
jgi:hypothetical protein